MKRRYLFVSLLILAALVLPVLAQGRPDLSKVYVTTQDYAKLRLGPGENWDTLTVLPYGLTLRATGRSFDSRWIQVAYEGAIDPTATDSATVGDVTYGWVAYWLLVWTGDILDLPLDGVSTVRMARSAGSTILVSPDTHYYVDGVDPSTRISGTITDPVEVEVTGRLGSPQAGYFWLQFTYNGQYYWTATWEVGVPKGYSRLADGSAVFPYGRLLTQLRQTLNSSSSSLSGISRRWQDLDAGYQTTCNAIPAHVRIRSDFFLDNDLNVEVDYTAPVNAIRAGVDNINQAISLFEQVCARSGSERFASAEEVQQGLDYSAEASRQFDVVRLFLTPFERRNPLLGGLSNKPAGYP